MTNKQKALAKAKELNIAIFRTKDRVQEFQVDAPRGYKFVLTELHYMICFGWDDIAERISGGIEKCEEHDCDVCCSVEERKTAQEYADWMGWELIIGSDKF